MKRLFLKAAFCLLILSLTATFALAQGIETMGGNSVNMASDVAGMQNGMGSLMSGLTAGRLAVESAGHFGRCPPFNQGECVLGAIKALQALLSMMQMGAHGATQAGADFSSFNTDGTSYGAANTNPDPMDPNNPAFADPDFRALKDNMARLQNGIAGSKLDIKKGTVTMADGTKLSLKDISSPEAMAAAGIPAGAIAGLAAYNAKLNKEIQDKLKIGAMTATSGFDESGSGSGGGSSSGGGAPSDTGSPSTINGRRTPLDRDPSSMAGMQKNYNGEPIGVASDSIFGMMNRRYKLKESQDSFFSEADLSLQK